MENGDALEIMKAIGDLKSDIATKIGQVETALVAKIGAVETSVAGLSGSLKAQVDAVDKKHETAVATLRHEVLSEDGRIPKIEASIADDKRWQNIKHAAGPVMVILHAVARKLGIPV
jgi:hypothetical protein